MLLYFVGTIIFYVNCARVAIKFNVIFIFLVKNQWPFQQNCFFILRRWPVTMAVLSLLLVFCFILLFGVVRHARGALIAWVLSSFVIDKLAMHCVPQNNGSAAGLERGAIVCVSDGAQELRALRIESPPAEGLERALYGGVSFSAMFVFMTHEARARARCKFERVLSFSLAHWK